MNGVERGVVVIFFTFILTFPSAVQGYVLWVLAGDHMTFTGTALAAAGCLMAATVLAALQFCYILGYYFCSRCVNFSCPFNRVPGDLQGLWGGTRL